MERQTLRAIEAKAAQVRRRYRVNPDRFVRWGLVGGAGIGSVACVVAAFTVMSSLQTVVEKLLGGALGGAIGGALIGGLVGFFISVLYEMSCGVADFVERLYKSKPRAADDADISLEEDPTPPSSNLYS